MRRRCKSSCRFVLNAAFVTLLQDFPANLCNFEKFARKAVKGAKDGTERALRRPDSAPDSA